MDVEHVLLHLRVIILRVIYLSILSRDKLYSVTCMYHSPQTTVYQVDHAAEAATVFVGSCISLIMLVIETFDQVENPWASKPVSL